MSEDKKENEEVVELNEEIKTENEGIQISNDVIAVIAGVAVSEVPGVSGMAGGFAGGISEVFSGKKNLAKGIKVDATETEAKIDVNIIVEYGTRIPDVAFEIQNRVKKAVENMTGFTDEEREKMTELLKSGFIDTFRYLYPDKTDSYTWWSYMGKAREKNVGWRIDYFIVSDRIKDKIQDAIIYPEIFGSDHCPVGLEVLLETEKKHPVSKK